MSSNPPTAPIEGLPKPPVPATGIKLALQYTGIPKSWLDKRPKLPGRNWLIFWAITSSTIGLYVYDRQQSKKIRNDYVERVKHLADQPIASTDWPRKVTVYAAKWPGDDEPDNPMKYFRRYVKPVLVAAAIDFDMIKGKRHGELANQIAEEIKARRRIDAGLDTAPDPLLAIPTRKPVTEKRKYELEGGIVIVGRQTFKEFMAGQKRGWTEGLEKIDRDEVLAQELGADGRFDEVEEGTEAPSFPTEQPIPTPQSQSPLPPSIPILPPLLLVSYTNHIGFKQIPLMIWEFFNQRHKVRAGAEAAFTLVQAHTRPFAAPVASPSFPAEPITTPSEGSESKGDLDFDKGPESWYVRRVHKIPKDIEKTREKYYAALPERLATARALARGTREPTSDELANAPPSEVMLAAERMKKEARWRADVAGWEVVRPESEVECDARLKEALRVFVSEEN